ncbi:hypothetical protein, variant 1 [Aphanomyces astaci]|uniref:microtubule-severing ATPase n=1 Tax=Aphanomyces astaci TaxID=112090 RepID=W4FCS5_APHAT|nr:hypothetical protein, variant 1 [Aphanomyces astaci]ETV64616.1 hypothetical protein, variant 1 [Aphanomyces astaci]|eukprot:XP_009845908.1 hypothetical protein, variant 1 [Aphanomyces astaci]
MFLFSFMKSSTEVAKGQPTPSPSEKEAKFLHALANRAITADERGQVDTAIDLYVELIERMLVQVRGVHDPDEQLVLRRRIEGYVKRAEELKVAAAPPSAAPPAVKSKTQSKARTANAALAHVVLDEVLDASPNVQWKDIAGLDDAKQMLQEAIVLPLLRPDLFTGLCAAPKGALLFGPPGTGKTLLAKAVATESKATFFSVTASTLTSKWVGEGEKLVRALFDMARELQPSVIFIDEIDSLLSTRSTGEHDASRRLKNEFFTQLDGIGSSSEDRILVLGATNLPHELDEAMVRRLEKRVYVPLPDIAARTYLIGHLVSSHSHSLTQRDIAAIASATDKYSGSDIMNLCKEAAMGPLRSLGDRLKQARAQDIRPISKADFTDALARVSPSVSADTLRRLTEWNARYGLQKAT